MTGMGSLTSWRGSSSCCSKRRRRTRPASSTRSTRAIVQRRAGGSRAASQTTADQQGLSKHSMPSPFAGTCRQRLWRRGGVSFVWRPGVRSLCRPRARAIATSAPEGGSASHAWSFAVTRLTREQRAEGEGGATSDAPTAPECCLDFEDYLVIRGFTEAACLEDQFRFLWRLLDDDRDGVFSRDDLLHALQLAAALLGWDERTIGRWMKWTVRALGMPESDSSSAKPIGAPEVRSALGSPHSCVRTTSTRSCCSQLCARVRMNKLSRGREPAGTRIDERRAARPGPTLHRVVVLRGARTYRVQL